MPYREVNKARGIKYPALVEDLAKELSTAGSGDPRYVPVILLEWTKGGSPSLHVFVVWDDQQWTEIDRAERSEVIMDAMEKARPDEALKVTIAMGLTSDEAKRLKINLTK